MKMSGLSCWRGRVFAQSFIIALVVSTSAALHAQVPQLINYQGRVVVGATNFDGGGGFKFALVNAAGTTTYWSNNNSSVNGSEPTAAVSLTVSNGLYSVLLGDTAITNMTSPIPATVFNNTDVRLRVWFNDGTHASQLLSPDQRVAAVGYAVMASNVPDGTITSAKIANGAIGTAQLAANAVTSANIAAGAVGTLQLANNAVTTANIANGAITSAQLAKPPRSGSVNSSAIIFDFGIGNFSVPFSPAFNGTPAVTLAVETSDPNVAPVAWVQTKSASSFTGRADAGRPRPVLIPFNGSNTSLAVVNGNPAISYRGLSLSYTRATNANGTAWGTPIGLDSSGDNGQDNALAIVNGNPAISYLDNTNKDLKFVRATDVNGTAWAAPVPVDTVGDVGHFTSLKVVNGNPAISYYDLTNLNLKYVRATNSSGTAWATPVSVDTAGDVGGFTSLAVVNGNPAISYYDATNGDLKFVRATDINGATWGAPVAVDTGGDVGLHTSLVVVNGNPAIAYEDANLNGGLTYVRATNANGTAWGTPVHADPMGANSVDISLALVSGNPAISYRRIVTAQDSDLRYTRATDANGAAWGASVSLDVADDVGFDDSLAVVNGSPAISYRNNTKAQLSFIRESTPPFVINWVALEP